MHTTRRKAGCASYRKDRPPGREVVGTGGDISLPAPMSWARLGITSKRMRWSAIRGGFADGAGRPRVPPAETALHCNHYAPYRITVKFCVIPRVFHTPIAKPAHYAHTFEVPVLNPRIHAGNTIQKGGAMN